MKWTHDVSLTPSKKLRLSINSDWSEYQHVTDSGILDEILFSEGYSGSKEIKFE